MGFMESVIIDCLHLTPIEGLIPTDGHLASTEALVITEGPYLATLIEDCPLVCINNCHFKKR